MQYGILTVGNSQLLIQITDMRFIGSRRHGKFTGDLLIGVA